VFSSEPGRILPLPASYFAGKDLAEIEVSANAMPAPLAPTSLSITVSDEPASTSAEDSIPDSAPSAGTQSEDKAEPSDKNLADGKVANPPKDGEVAKSDQIGKEGSSEEGTKTPTGTEANGGKPIRIDFKCEECGVCCRPEPSGDTVPLTAVYRTLLSLGFAITASTRLVRTSTSVRSAWTRTCIRRTTRSSG
jgi:hypothetical protein